ncbi:Stp1/IreP family PP2C-type Ser/Thr phosphatase [Spirosoma sp. BT702]|uniref:Stp1/IreP family PP2C-type Ser/Thr phosphatase n=1 Tax=Spirosoma profusum TaxID=2771354 RepID=A0A927ARZ4_9BACT|nr:Stp1/IreP family PP2C-type Ser/Thr phosphatase [Spirosoma profusum]MBD2700455.1 Stp1/IreP family PP2C-type Ser/Thr phosphatase [Spirosoma profusum]
MKNFIKRLFGQNNPAALPETAESVIEPTVLTPTPSGESIFTGEVNAIVVSDLGNVRQNNEDTGLFVRLADEGVRRTKGYLLLVADGMGGHLAGEVASQMAAELVNREYFQHNENIEKSLSRAFQIANRQIFEEARLHDTFRGMGTTCTAIVVHEQQLYFAHVGDSRAYLFKAGQLIQITQDHTYIQELLRKGDISPEAAASHPERNVLTQAMGTKASVQIDLGRCILPFDNGDRLMLCSDGLYEYCLEADFVRILQQQSLHDAATELVNLAKSRGGHDNITIVLAERIMADENPLPKETREIDVPFTRDIELPQ